MFTDGLKASIKVVSLIARDARLLLVWITEFSKPMWRWLLQLCVVSSNDPYLYPLDIGSSKPSLLWLMKSVFSGSATVNLSGYFHGITVESVILEKDCSIHYKCLYLNSSWWRSRHWRDLWLMRLIQWIGWNIKTHFLHYLELCACMSQNVLQLAIPRTVSTFYFVPPETLYSGKRKWLRVEWMLPRETLH